MSKRRDRQKEERDSRTAYTTFLPPMDEGFHVGYQPAPGVASDRNQRPREWLENLARFLRAGGEDAGYAIPDVLAGEQQLRRLMRMPRDAAMRRQQMIDYRATLALLLLWDFWPRDDTWPELSLVRADGGDTPFSAAVLTALAPQRAAEGLRLFTLTRRVGDVPDERPIGMLSRLTGVTPAADPGDLCDFLPACVRWYDRARKRFMDPCDFLNEGEIAVLTTKLRLLQALNERPELRSPLYAPEAQLGATLARFIADLRARRARWRERLERGDEEAENDLRARLLVLYGMDGEPRVTKRRVRAEDMPRNPLLRQLLPTDAALPEDIEDDGATLYLLDGRAFARESDFCALEPALVADEDDTLRAAERELDLLSRFRAGWNARAADALAALAAERRERVGFSPRAVALLGEWAEELGGAPMSADRGVTLTYPMKECPATLRALLDSMIGLKDEACLLSPMSDCLLLVTGADRPPFDQPALSRACLVEEAEGAPARYAVPPLSPALCAWLQEQGERGDPEAASLRAGSFKFRYLPDENEVEASFRVTARRREGEAATYNAVAFRRRYRLCERMETDAAFQMEAGALPYVVAWPNARLGDGLWKRYYVYAHQPDRLDVWALDQNGWTQGERLRAEDEGTRRQTRERVWQTVCTERFPAYVALKRGPLALGALVNDRPRRQLKLEPPAVISIDFGSNATTVMMRQGEKVQPAALPRCMHQALLRADEDGGRYLVDELLPRTALVCGEHANESSFYSVMDMFTDDADRWRRELIDGHIYYRESLASLLRKSESALYYDLKWGEEGYVLRLIRLFLRQVMAQAALAARLWGSPSVTWRVSMPNALPADRQEAYLETVRGLSREIAEDTGVPLTPGCVPVLYASENQADGLYFRSRNEVNARGGYLNIDVGGGTTDLSLWLGGAAHATAESSLRLGCRQMLFDSVAAWHVEEFQADFEETGAGEDAAEGAREIAKLLREGLATTRGRQKSMLLMDDFFAVYADDIRAVMQARRARGGLTCVESLLLFNFSFLFCLAGEMLERAWREPEVRDGLPARMELCIAGNGGQLLKCFADEQREKLCKLALSMLSAEHPLRGLWPVQSRNPKQEVAIGLLSDEGLQSSVTARDRWNGTTDADAGKKQNLLPRFVTLFAAQFPQAAKKLMPAALTGARLTGDAEIELDTIFQNERGRTPDDDLTMYARCFAGMKRLWRI